MMSATELISVDQLAPLLEALGCGAALIERDGTIRHANARLSAMMKRSRAELDGANLIQFCRSDEQQADVREALAHFDDAQEGESFLPLPDGSRLPVVSCARTPGDRDASSSSLRLVTMIDISAQKLAEQRLRDQYNIIVEMSNTVLEQALELKAHSELLERRVADRTRQLHEANLDAMHMLAVAAEAKDADTGAHVLRIQKLAEAIALKLGLSTAAARDIGQAAILHDVGKIHVPDAILAKPGPLSDEQRKEMQSHTLVGEHILSSRSFFDTARRVARWHHENWDGTGYPDGLAGEAIPIEARITRVADVWDALTHERVYKPMWPAARAMARLRAGRGTEFEPRVVDALIALAESGDLSAE